MGGAISTVLLKMSFFRVKKIMFPRLRITAQRAFKDSYFILREVKHFPKLLLLAILSPLIAALFEACGIGLLYGFLQGLVDSANPLFKTGIQWFDQSVLGVEYSTINRLCRLSLLILISTWLKAFFNWSTLVSMDLARAKLINQLHQKVFEQIQSLSLGFFDKSRTGDLVNTLTTEITQLKIAVQMYSSLLTRSITAFAYAVILFSISWQLTVIAVLLFALVSCALLMLNGRIREKSVEASQANGDFAMVAVELVNGIRTIQSFSTQDFERRKFHRVSKRIERVSSELAYRFWLPKPLSEGLGSTVLIAIVIVGLTVFVDQGLLEVASLLTFLFALLRFLPAVQEINGGIAYLSSLQGSVENVGSFLEKADKSYMSDGELPFLGLSNQIEFQAVSFAYDSDNPVLDEISLTIEKGETVALVGPSGSGKTTLVDLIARFYPVGSGQILLDGIPIESFRLASLRPKMAIVSQDTFIFNASVHENIAYGSEGVSDDEVVEAARLANALDFIREMPEGFGTRLGDRGTRLSGGQRQRIAIARALLRNPEILILDEATSALDSVTEQLIQESLENLAKGRTVIAIAHRLSTIRKADKVFFVEQGQIIESGTYDDLLEKRGSLWKYHMAQNQVDQPSLVEVEASFGC